MKNRVILENNGPFGCSFTVKHRGLTGFLNQIPLKSISFVIASTIMLSACGGGNGGGSSAAIPNPGNGGGSSAAIPNPGTGDSQAVSLTERQLYGDIDVYKDLAANSPNFGSITQSSNGNGISTDRVETTLDANGELTVTVRDGNGDVSLELDSQQHVYENLNGTAWMDDSDDNFPANWSGNGWILSKQEGGETVVAFAYTAWDDGDVTNYSAGGYWIKGNAAEGVTEIGTFGDAGPGSVFGYYDDPQSRPWVLPVAAGTASYLGSAEGAYVNPAGDAGVWWSRLLLRANFVIKSISGCVGCPDADPGGGDRGVYTYTTVEDLKADRWIEEDFYISLKGSGNIDNDGDFEGTLKVLKLSTQSELVSQGKWGGVFSWNNNESTYPEQVGGTLGGTTAEGMGFIGVFSGGRRQQ